MCGLVLSVTHCAVCVDGGVLLGGRVGQNSASRRFSWCSQWMMQRYSAVCIGSVGSTCWLSGLPELGWTWSDRIEELPA